MTAHYLAVERSYLTCHVWTEFCDIHIDRVTTRMVEDWMTRLSRESGGRQSSALSATTVNRCFVCLRKVYLDGVRRGELPFNPAEGVDLMKESPASG